MSGDITHINSNNERKQNDSLEIFNSREAFFNWLSERSARKTSAYSAKMLLTAIDVASDYAFETGLSDICIWSCTSEKDFLPIYRNIVSDDTFRITDSNIYRCFISAGRLFSEYINLPKPLNHKIVGSCADESLEAEFVEWINVTYSNKTYNANIVLFLNSISNYAMKSGICNESLWKIHDVDSLRPILEKLRTTDKTPFYKMGVSSRGFVDSLRVYFRFIDERQLSRNAEKTPPVETTKKGGEGEVGLPVYRRYLEHAENGNTIATALHERNNSEYMTEMKESAPDVERNTVIFKKAVDWSLLHYGITIPQKKLDMFFSVLGKRIDASCPSANVLIQFNDKTFRAKVYLNGKATQIRWTDKDAIAVELRFVFNDSYERLKAERSSDAVKSFAESPDYINVIASNQPGTIRFITRNSIIKSLNAEVYESSRKFNETQVKQKTTAIDREISDNLTTVLSKRFASGFRLNSPIELMRFRKFYAEDNGREISLHDEELTSRIIICGTVFDGKVYTVSDETKIRIKERAEDYFSYV